MQRDGLAGRTARTRAGEDRDTMHTLANIENPVIWVVIIGVLLLFGGQKIPEMMRGVGQGMREFKKGINEKDDETKPSDLKIP